MMICFGKNLKRLRKERELTQEELASFFGVSFQTVSKWERGETYPDILTLSEMAVFFDVSTDALLGVTQPQKEERIQYYLSLFNEMPLKNVSDVLEEYRQAVKEFPNEYPLLINYMELLHIEKGNVHVNEYQPLSDEMLAIYEKIQKYCTVDAVRIRAKRLMLRHLMWQYQCLGWLDDKEKFDKKYKKQAETIFETLPSISDSREYLSLCLIDFEPFDYVKSLESSRNTIEELSYLLQNVIIGYCYYDNAFTAEYKVDIISAMNTILQMLGEDNKNAIHIIYNYGHLGHLYAEIGDSENALKALRTAAERAIAFDALPDAERIMLFYEQEKTFRNMPMKKRLYELFTKHYPLSDEFKATKEFQDIVLMLKA